MSKKAATVGDIGTDHDGFPPTPIIEGSQDIIIDNKPAARVGDALAPHAKPNHPPHDRAITTGSKTVFFNYKPAALTGSDVGCGGVIIGGSSVIIGDQAPSGSAKTPSEMIIDTSLEYFFEIECDDGSPVTLAYRIDSSDVKLHEGELCSDGKTAAFPMDQAGEPTFWIPMA